MSELILSNLLSDKTISDEVLLEFICEVNIYINTESFGEAPPSFYRLTEYVKNIATPEKLSTIPMTLVFIYGKLWSVLSLAEIAEHEESLKLSIDEDAKRYIDRYEVFDTVRTNRGISHKSLANAVKMSPSALSQFMSRMENGRYLFSRQIGRRKYYYITNNGEVLISKMDEVRHMEKSTRLMKILNVLPEDKAVIIKLFYALLHRYFSIKLENKKMWHHHDNTDTIYNLDGFVSDYSRLESHKSSRKYHVDAISTNAIICQNQKRNNLFASMQKAFPEFSSSSDVPQYVNREANILDIEDEEYYPLYNRHTNQNYGVRVE